MFKRERVLFSSRFHNVISILIVNVSETEVGERGYRRCTKKCH